MTLTSWIPRLLWLSIALAVILPLLPITTHADEASSTPAENTATSTTDTDVAPTVSTSLDTPLPSLQGRGAIMQTFVATQSLSGNVIFSNTSTADPLSLVEGPLGGHYISIDQKMTALHTGSITQMQLYLAENSSGENPNIRVDVYDESGTQELCLLIFTGALTRPNDEWNSIPYGIAPGFVTWQSRAFGNHCTFDEGTIYTVKLQTTSEGPSSIVRIFTAGNAPSDFYFVASDEPEAPPICTEHCNSSVLFLPGIEGSRLYNSTGKLWEPSNNFSAINLDLNIAGHGGPDIHTKEEDVISVASSIGIYKRFADEMNNLVATRTIARFEMVPYDWRLPITQLLDTGHDINGDIYFDGPQSATSTPYIIQELRSLAASSYNGKVTIVAHSNGGLVAKALLQRLKDINDPLLSHIDKLILVASPQAGTPEGIAGLLNGHNTGLPFHSLPFVVDQATMRNLGVNAPGAYALLPSKQYFTYVDNPAVVIATSSLPSWAATYGSTIHSGELLHEFLVGTLDRVNPGSYDTGSPDTLNSALLTQAEDFHNSIDAWTPPDGLRVIQIAGWGIPSTLSTLTYSYGNKPSCPATDSSTCITFVQGPKYSASFTVDGDGTVVAPSALWVGANGAERYWMNLYDYDNTHQADALLGIAKFDHGRILDTNSVADFISDIVTDHQKPLAGNYENYLSSSAPQSTNSRLQYSLHSPLSLDLYDDQGRHTGVSTTTGYIEQQIPGTYFVQYGDEKYAFSNTGSHIHLIMKGYANSTFTLGIAKLNGDQQVSNTEFKDVATKTTTTVVTDITADSDAPATLVIDQNGDGQPDNYVAPDGSALSLYQLITNLTTTVNTLQIKDKAKTQLLNKIANINAKIAKQQQKQTSILAQLQAQVAKKAGKGKIDTATANTISSLLDSLVAQDTAIPLDSVLIQQLTDEINTANITAQLKTNLLNKIVRLQNLATVNRSLDTTIKAITNKAAKAVLSDTDAQNLLNLLDQIQTAI